MNRIAIILKLLASTLVSPILAQTTTIVFPNTNLPNLNLQNANLPSTNLQNANPPSSNLLNGGDQQTAGKQPLSNLATVVPPSNLPNQSPIANQNDFRASAPIVNTNELWRMLSKLRIGSFFTSRSIKCECPSASQPTAATLIPIPMVERIHHHYDKQPQSDHQRDDLNRMRVGRATHDLKGALEQAKGLYDAKTLAEIRDLIDAKNVHDLKYPYDVGNVQNLYDFKSNEIVHPRTLLKPNAHGNAHGLGSDLAEASGQKDSWMPDKARFSELNDLISENGQRSISSAVKASSFGNQHQANALTSLQDTLLLNADALREQLANDPLMKEQLLAKALSKQPFRPVAHRPSGLQDDAPYSTSKDELADSSAWLDDSLNGLNNLDKRSPLLPADLEGRLDVHGSFHPGKAMNEIARLLVSELDNGDPTRQRDLSGAYLSKVKILKLLGDLERFMVQNDRWLPPLRSATGRRSPADYRLLHQTDARRLSGVSRWLSSGARDTNGLQANSLASSLLSNLASSNETATGGKRSLVKNKKAGWTSKPSESDEWGDDESEYFTDVADYLPSESVLKFAPSLDHFNNRTPETDFLPITNPTSLFIRPDQRENKSKQLKPAIK